MALPGIEAQSNGMVKQRDVQSSKGKAGRRSAQQWRCAAWRRAAKAKFRCARHSAVTRRKGEATPSAA